MAPAIRVQNARTDQELQVETVQPGKLLGDWHQCPWTFYNHLFRFGVCCLFIVNSATTTINENCTYIQNPNFPASYASSTALTFTVAKCATGLLYFAFFEDSIKTFSFRCLLIANWFWILPSWRTNINAGNWILRGYFSNYRNQNCIRREGILKNHWFQSTAGLTYPVICGINQGEHGKKA